MQMRLEGRARVLWLRVFRMRPPIGCGVEVCLVPIWGASAQIEAVFRELESQLAGVRWWEGSEQEIGGRMPESRRKIIVWASVIVYLRSFTRLL